MEDIEWSKIQELNRAYSRHGAESICSPHLGPGRRQLAYSTSGRYCMLWHSFHKQPVFALNGPHCQAPRLLNEPGQSCAGI